jgi:radical SAM protein with 4Fe4S-binding SPASM domain
MRGHLPEGYLHRCYDNLVVLYHVSTNKYVVLEDIYAVFFLYFVEQGLCDAEVVSKVTFEYDAPPNIIKDDFFEFKKTLECVFLGIAEETHCNNLIVSEYEQNENYIFGLMAERLIPFTATIEITDKCNLNCVHCYREHNEVSLWTIELFERVLKELKCLGTLHLVFSGSEPMIHPEIKTFLRLAKQLDFVLTIQSNLTLLDDDLVNFLKTCALRNVYTSLYSGSREVHDYITKIPGSFDKTVEAISKLMKAHIPIAVNATIFSINSGEVYNIHKFCKNIGVECNYNFKIIPSVDVEHDVLCYNCFDEDMMFKYLIDDELMMFCKEISQIENNVTNNQVRYCATSFRSITVSYALDVLLCNAYRKKCGNLLEESTESIWKHSYEINLWRSNYSLVKDSCKNCRAYAFCEPCPAHNFTKTGGNSDIDEITCKYGEMFYNAYLRLKEVKQAQY